MASSYAEPSEKGKEVIAQFEKLKSVRSPLDREYRERCEYTSPSLGVGFDEGVDGDGISNAQNAKAKQSRLLDGTSSAALRMLASSILSSLTPPNTLGSISLIGLGSKTIWIRRTRSGCSYIRLLHHPTYQPLHRVRRPSNDRRAINNTPWSVVSKGQQPMQYRHPQTDLGRPKRIGCPMSISTHVVAFTDLNAAVAQDGIGSGHVKEKLRQAVVQ